MKLRLEIEQTGFSLVLAGRTVLRHSADCPSVTVARGHPTVTMLRGNFRIEDAPQGQTTPRDWHRDGDAVVLCDDTVPVVRIAWTDADLTVTACDPANDRIHVRLYADPHEYVWGGGEQMSYFALNGRRFPMWTSEPGVGRDKSTALTQVMDQTGMAGGDYWNTNYPQPTFMTSRWLAVHCDTTCYSVLDFTDPAHHGVEIWASSARFVLFAQDDPHHLIARLASYFGRPPALPDWAIGGAIVGLKAGFASFDRLERFVDAGTSVAALWCEDWAGVRETSFGRRLFWDWRYSAARYPDLPARIDALHARGIRFMAYANPYLAVDGALYREAQAGGHLCLRQDSDAVYLVDFGEFDCGVLDFTRAETCDWFAERVLGREMLDIGIDGWMADFGEYLPTDVRLASGIDAMAAHNLWPVLWAQVNAAALAARGRTGDALFFMRAGFSGVSRHCPLLWAGDQSVDFTRHDGIGTVITAALSAGLVGNAYSHSDCGGYTSLHGNVRSVELMQRWCELAAFAPVMRSHEGNRPDDNLQYDSTPELLACFAAWSRVHAHLAPYVRHLCDDAVATGLPVQRPLFVHYPADRELYAIQDQYLYGADLLVAPVIEAGSTTRCVVLPGDRPWRHVWTGQDHAPGTVTIAAPIGQPPVFYRPDSVYAALFAGLREIMAP
ncbi:alpha-glucosidase [Novosphingobium sp. FSW06-99]|uniref:alpha-glucosidase n=1 Tax=Novosphingobium sp. FSW06-99 TaxID=1739113 RepID=UPI00076CE678|nr:alpha-glucosidase [Novosphingobium sp. FSW06-99]KUR73372.1 alpha-xylosidase [Novosphingobium sp. FSW06-99]